jgi:hypothetical protein
MASIFNDVSISCYPSLVVICNTVSAGSKSRDGIREILPLTHQEVLYWSHYKHDFLLDRESKTSTDKCEFSLLGIRNKAKALFCGILPIFEGTLIFGTVTGVTICPSDKSNMWIKTRLAH